MKRTKFTLLAMATIGLTACLSACSKKEPVEKDEMYKIAYVNHIFFVYENKKGMAITHDPDCPHDLQSRFLEEIKDKNTEEIPEITNTEIPEIQNTNIRNTEIRTDVLED